MSARDIKYNFYLSFGLLFLYSCLLANRTERLSTRHAHSLRNITRQFALHVCLTHRTPTLNSRPRSNSSIEHACSWPTPQHVRLTWVQRRQALDILRPMLWHRCTSSHISRFREARVIGRYIWTWRVIGWPRRVSVRQKMKRPKRRWR